LKKTQKVKEAQANAIKEYEKYIESQKEIIIIDGKDITKQNKLIDPGIDE